MRKIGGDRAGDSPSVSQIRMPRRYPSVFIFDFWRLYRGEGGGGGSVWVFVFPLWGNNMKTPLFRKIVKMGGGGGFDVFGGFGGLTPIVEKTASRGTFSEISGICRMNSAF